MAASDLSCLFTRVLCLPSHLSAIRLLTHGELWQASATTLQGAVGHLSSLQNFLLFPFPSICSFWIQEAVVFHITFIVVYSASPNQTHHKENHIHKRCDKRLHTTHLLSAGKSGARYRSFSVLYLFMWYFPPICLLFIESVQNVEMFLWLNAGCVCFSLSPALSWQSQRKGLAWSLLRCAREFKF